MDNLFKALPRDLQWEILADFVGTHTVRNGKLIRKLGIFMFGKKRFNKYLQLLQTP
jgi:hypothetical protein